MVSCWEPGLIGTEPARPAAGAAIGTGSEGACVWSLMLTTGPSGWPSAWAYWAAFVLASATARARAVASSPLVSVRFSETPSTVTALPPACTAA